MNDHVDIIIWIIIYNDIMGYICCTAAQCGIPFLMHLSDMHHLYMNTADVIVVSIGITYNKCIIV